MAGLLEEKNIREGKLLAALSYLSILCIVSLAFKKNNGFVLFHAKQGLALFVLEVACFLLSIIPVLSWLIRTFGLLIFALLSMWGIFEALRGKTSRIPLIFNLSEKIIL